jgi:hypothetical protein
MEVAFYEKQLCGGRGVINTLLEFPNYAQSAGPHTPILGV